MTTPPRWQNWAGTVTAHPARMLAPRDETEVARVVRWAGRSGLAVRAVGAGHSFTPAAATSGVLLNLDALAALEDVTALPGGGALVTVGAGVRLHALNRLLAELGLAMANLGDVDRQSIAGAVSTGTHGTGARLGGLATQVTAVRLVGADGEVRAASAQRDPGLFEAARLGLGAVGVLTALTLRTVPAFTLLAREEVHPLADALAALDSWAEDHDHVDLYWFPGTETALVKRNDRVPAGSGPRLGRVRGWVEDELLANGVFEATNRLATTAPALVPRLNAFAAGALSDRTYAAPSHRVFASPRRVRFTEMEYAVPRAALPDVLAEVAAWLARTGEPVPFPIEVRFAAADDVWLSTAHGRESAYVAVHQYHRMSPTRYFAAVERIMAAAGGRPHWGKVHGLTAADLAPRYPRFADFLAVRAAADPEGRFANPYTDRVFGPVPAAR